MKEILWNIINSILAGGLVFLGGCSTGNISKETILFALIAGGTAAVIQFKDYWSSAEPKKTLGLFKFL